MYCVTQVPNKYAAETEVCRVYTIGQIFRILQFLNSFFDMHFTFSNVFASYICLILHHKKHFIPHLTTKSHFGKRGWKDAG